MPRKPQKPDENILTEKSLAADIFDQDPGNLLNKRKPLGKRMRPFVETMLEPLVDYYHEEEGLHTLPEVRRQGSDVFESDREKLRELLHKGAANALKEIKEQTPGGSSDKTLETMLLREVVNGITQSLSRQRGMH